MVGTLPGRTQGLGLITEPLLRDLGVTRVAYAQINLVATLVGALFCAGIGRLLDRQGSRVVLTALAIALGLVVVAMSRATGLIRFSCSSRSRAALVKARSRLSASRWLASGSAAG